MAEGGLSIGTLSGQIELEDGKFTSTINLSNEALDELEKRFGGADNAARATAQGMLTAEAAIEAVKEVAHLAAETLSEISVEGAKVADVEEHFNRLTLSAGMLGDELLGNLKTGTHNTITDFELMKSVNDNMAAGVKLSSDQYNTLATGAFALTHAKGMDVKDAFDKINDALLTGKVRGVQYLVGKLDLAAAEDVYAAKLHTSSDRLTADEKIQAAREAILRKVGDATQRLGTQQDGLDIKISQSATQWNNFMEDLGKAVARSPVILGAFDEIKSSIAEAFGGDQDELIKTITGDLESAARVAVELVHAGVDIVEFAREYKAVLEPLVVGLGAYYAASMLAAAGEKAVATGAEFIAALKTPFGEVAIAAAAIYAAFELGHWQPISDFFEKMGLRAQGLSSAEADAAVATHHLTDAQNAGAEAAKRHAAAAEEIQLATQNYKEVLTTIEPEIAKQAESLLTSGVSAKAVAEQFGLTASQAHALEQDLAAVAKAADDQAKATAAGTEQQRLSRQESKDLLVAWENLNSLGKTYQETLHGIAPSIKESVTHFAEMGASVQDLTKAFPALTKAQAEAAVASVKAANDIQKEWETTFGIIANIHGNDINDFIKLEQMRSDRNIALLQQSGKATQEALDAEKAHFEATIDAEIQKREEQITTSRGFFQKQVDDAKAKLDLELHNTNDFVDADIRAATRDLEEKERILNHWTQAANDKLESQTDKTTQETGKQSSTIKQLADDWNTVGVSIDKSTEKVRTLSGEVISLKEYEARQLAGGSTQVTAANFGYELSQIQLASGGNLGGHTGEAAVWARQGYSFAEIVTALEGGQLSPTPVGPRIPGFREGGVGDFGKETIAALHGKEAIIPLDKFGGDIGNTTVNIYVNGTAQEVAGKVADEFMRRLKQRRQYGAA